MASLQTRVVNILKSPNTEWPVIAAESTDVGTLFKSYIMPLAAIPAVATLIGGSIIGGVFGRTSLGLGLTTMVVMYVMGLVGCYISAMVIEWLAPKFKSSGSRVDALKLVAYAYTPVWVAGILNILPLLGILALLAGLYAIYLFYLGLPHMMKTPADQVVIYMIVSAVVIIVINFVLFAIAGMFTLSAGLAAM